MDRLPLEIVEFVLQYLTFDDLWELQKAVQGVARLDDIVKLCIQERDWLVCTTLAVYKLPPNTLQTLNQEQIYMAGEAALCLTHGSKPLPGDVLPLFMHKTQPKLLEIITTNGYELVKDPYRNGLDTIHFSSTASMWDDKTAEIFSLKGTYVGNLLGAEPTLSDENYYDGYFQTTMSIYAADERMIHIICVDTQSGIPHAIRAHANSCYMANWLIDGTLHQEIITKLGMFTFDCSGIQTESKRLEHDIQINKACSKAS